MTKFKNLFRILFFLAIISAVSCEKIIDFLPGKTKDCRIKRIHFIDGVWIIMAIFIITGLEIPTV
jgi:hypothetical protein